jgi:ABC-type nitrate/sulfonate/bicarbonate transport system substrate-binding protein
MKSWRNLFFSTVTVILVLGSVCFIGCSKEEPTLIPIRVGWQTSWVPQAQLAMVLKRTNLLHLNGLRGEFSGFTYGGPLAEAALADKVDTLFAADQPAINLIARGAKWKIVSKCTHFRDALLVPLASPVMNVTDLRGKKIAVPFGSGAHRIVLELVREAGLDPAKDLTLVNVDVTEINAIVQAGPVDEVNALWRGEIAAAANWDPNIADFEEKKLARVLVEKPLFGVTAMSEKFIHTNPQAAVAFIKALQEAVFYYGKHETEANTWYSQELNIKLSPIVLSRSASFDQNLKADSVDKVVLSFTAAEIQVLQNSSDFAFGAGLIKTHPVAKDIVDTDLIARAKKSLAGDKFNPETVRPVTQ